jgi:V/A-type H+-transporting ATPase subunit E
MSGLDRILNQIEEEAKASADAILSQAKEQAAEILAEADAQVETVEAEAKTRQTAAEEDILKKASSAAQMSRKQQLLAAKQDVITRILEQAKATMLALPDEEYFAVITKMLDEFVLGDEGEILFNKKDLGRLPAGYEKVIAKASVNKGGSLTLSKETRPIDGGFVLVYGGIEENCSFEAIFASEKESLRDKIHSVLFQ